MATLRDAQLKLDSAGGNNAGKTPPSIEEILRGTAHAMTIYRSTKWLRLFFRFCRTDTGEDRI